MWTIFFSTQAPGGSYSSQHIGNWKSISAFIKLKNWFGTAAMKTNGEIEKMSFLSVPHQLQRGSIPFIVRSLMPLRGRLSREPRSASVPGVALRGLYQARVVDWQRPYDLWRALVLPCHCRTARGRRWEWAHRSEKKRRSILPHLHNVNRQVECLVFCQMLHYLLLWRLWFSTIQEFIR